MQEREEVELSERCCEVKRPQDLKTLPGAGRRDGKEKRKKEDGNEKDKV